MTGDVVKFTLGGVVAADMRLVSGSVLLDHSMLTGESVPIEAAAGTQTFAGALVRRGEAVAVVTATGTHTRFGRTAELVRTAHVASSQQKAVLLVVRNLATFSGGVIAMLLACALYLHMPIADIVPLVLTAVLASIPVALPATFTLSAALGARALAGRGVLSTRPGLVGIVAAVKEGRMTFQRILTYTLNSIIKKIVTALLLVFGLVMTGQAILTPLLMVILMIAGDFLAMSLTTDNVEPSPRPNTWRIGNQTIAGVIIGVALLAFCAGALAIGKFALVLGAGALQTLTFVVLAFGSQATLYAIRARAGACGGARPSLWLAASSVVDILIAVTLAVGGIAMTPLPAAVIGGLLAAAVAFAVVLAAAKIPVFTHLKMT